MNREEILEAQLQEAREFIEEALNDLRNGKPYDAQGCLEWYLTLCRKCQKRSQGCKIRYLPGLEEVAVVKACVLFEPKGGEKSA